MIVVYSRRDKRGQTDHQFDPGRTDEGGFEQHDVEQDRAALVRAEGERAARERAERELAALVRAERDRLVRERASNGPSVFDETSARPALRHQTIKGPAYVIDGDTIVVRKTQIRLFGIDAPELDHPFGKQAKWAMMKLCKNQTVFAEILETDTHGRTVAKCTLGDGTDLSAELVRQGLALDWPKFSGGAYRSLETSDARRRLWLADARQKGRMHVWERFEAGRRSSSNG